MDRCRCFAAQNVALAWNSSTSAVWEFKVALPRGRHLLTGSRNGLGSGVSGVRDSSFVCSKRENASRAGIQTDR